MVQSRQTENVATRCKNTSQDNFCSPFDMALGVKVLGLLKIISVQSLFIQSLCIFTVPTFRGTKKPSFYLSLLIFLQKGQKN